MKSIPFEKASIQLESDLLDLQLDLTRRIAQFEKLTRRVVRSIRLTRRCSTVTNEYLSYTPSTPGESFLDSVFIDLSPLQLMDSDALLTNIQELRAVCESMPQGESMNECCGNENETVSKTEVN